MIKDAEDENKEVDDVAESLTKVVQKIDKNEDKDTLGTQSE